MRQAGELAAVVALDRLLMIAALFHSSLSHSNVAASAFVLSRTRGAQILRTYGV